MDGILDTIEVYMCRTTNSTRGTERLLIPRKNSSVGMWQVLYSLELHTILWNASHPLHLHQPSSLSFTSESFTFGLLGNRSAHHSWGKPWRKPIRRIESQVARNFVEAGTYLSVHVHPKRVARYLLEHKGLFYICLQKYGVAYCWFVLSLSFSTLWNLSYVYSMLGCLSAGFMKWTGHQEVL
jgi:hypothetical protein